MRRLGFAVWLPVLQSLLYLCLVGAAWSANRNFAPAAGISPFPFDAAFQRTSGGDPGLVKLAFAVNLPATAAATFLQWAVPDFAARNAMWYWIGCQVPVLWWLVGWWIDSELEIRTPRPPRAGRLWNAVRQAFLGAAIFAAFGCLGLLVEMFVQPAFRQIWDTPTGKLPWVALAAGLAFWPSFALSVAWKLIHRAREFRLAILLGALETDETTTPGIPPSE